MGIWTCQGIKAVFSQEHTALGRALRTHGQEVLCHIWIAHLDRIYARKAVLSEIFADQTLSCFIKKK